MGVVYRALDPRTGRDVALKLLLDAGPRFRERFARESRVLARLHHPNVVRVHDAGEAQGKPYLVMELVDGTPLEEELRRGPMAPRRAAELVASVARGAGHAHANGLVHRDIKPDNVLLRPDDHVVLTDFGLARDVEVASELSKTGIFMGTPGYASPEQARGDGKRVGPASDVYGLGALLFALLCGRPPHSGSLLEVMVLTINEPAPSPRADNPQVDSTLDALCRRAMAKDPADRYPDGDALADALEAYLRGELELPPRSVRSAFVALGILGVLALAAGLSLLLRQPARPDRPERPKPSATGATEAASPTPTAASPSPPPARSRALAGALRRAADPDSTPLSGERLNAAIESLAAALERAGPASNRPEAERRLAVLYTRRSALVLQRSPTQIASDLRSAIALHSTPARRAALCEALVGHALVVGGDLEVGPGWEEAQAAFREAMALAPQDPRPAMVFAKQARSRKQWATCLSANEEAARRAPDAEEPLIEMARALAHLGRAEEAVRRLRRYLAAHPNSPGAWCQLGHRERQQNRWARARRAYERAGGRKSSEHEVLAGLAAVALEERRHDLALDLCRRSLGLRHRNEMTAVLALALHRTGKHAKALSAFEKAWEVEESGPLRCDLVLDHLHALRALGRWKQANERLKTYLADERTSKQVGLLAQVIHHQTTRRKPQATQALRALLGDQTLADPRTDLALSEWLGRWGTFELPQVALKLALRAARARDDDEDAAAYLMAGRVLLRKGRHKEAWSALDKALAIHPTRADLHHTRAELGGYSGRYQLGLKSGRQARAYQPNEPYVCIYMTWCLLGLGRAREALPLLDFAVSKLPNSSAPALRALVRASTGDVAGARQDLERAVKHDPKSRKVRLARAQLLLATGDRQGAGAEFRKLQAERLDRYQADFVERALRRLETP